MKKIITSLLFLLVLCGSAFAVKAWEFEIKGIGGWAHASEDSLTSVNTLDDFLAGGGIDITRCWCDYIGIDLSCSSLYPAVIKSVHNGQIVTNTQAPTPCIALSLGLAIMFPITDQLKIKTVQSFGFMEYDRGISGEAFGDKHSVYSEDKFLHAGYFGSLGVTYMPHKNFGIDGGVDYNLFFGSNTETLESGYSFDSNTIGFSIRPYVGCTIRLGKKL